MRHSQRQPDSDEDLVSIIYDAVLDVDAWPTALKKMAVKIGCDDVHFALYDRSHSRQILCGMSLVPPSANEEYASKYFLHDKRVPQIIAAPPLLLLDDRNLQSSGDRSRSPFHQEFLPKYDIYFQLLSNLLASQRWFAVLVAGNSARRGEFSDVQKATLKRLLPHLQRAMRLYIKGYVLDSRLEIAAEAIDRLSIAVFVLSADCTVLSANAAGTAMLRVGDGVRERHSQFWLQDDRAIRALRTFVRSADNGQGSTAVASDQFIAARPSGMQPYHVFVYRLPRQATIWSADEGAAVLMFVSDPCKAPRRLGSFLIRSYGLTGAEAQVAVAIANGKTISQHAEDKRLSVDTVRFQVKQILQKADVHRQADFVRIISRSFSNFEVD
jgi:DNA-binding CsgD family transcriptional regulator